MEGYRVQTALDGEEGLASVEREMPGLILLDMKMPVMNGWGFVEKFRARHDHACPILVITASDSARAMAEEVGAAGYIGKPFDVSDLTAAVARHLNAPG
ncbi:MAG: response regulator [Dehalococcoidales bacterium]|nr:response regulator [Dehalococcoidales bacterium]